MKKLLGILGTIITAGSGTLTLVANSPSSIKTEEKILKRTKRWGEVQWVQIVQQWRNAELAYQKAGEEFQRNQNHTAFSQAQQRFLQAQQSFDNSKNEWQQGLTQWTNQIAQERSQQWWNNNNSSQTHEAERQWVYNKIDQVGNKIGLSANRQGIDQLLQEKWNMNNRFKRAIGCDAIGWTIFSGGAAVGSYFGGPIGTFFGGLFGAIFGYATYSSCQTTRDLFGV